MPGSGGQCLPPLRAVVARSCPRGAELPRVLARPQRIPCWTAGPPEAPGSACRLAGEWVWLRATWQTRGSVEESLPSVKLPNYETSFHQWNGGCRGGAIARKSCVCVTCGPARGDIATGGIAERCSATWVPSEEDVEIRPTRRATDMQWQRVINSVLRSHSDRGVGYCVPGGTVLLTQGVTFGSSLVASAECLSRVSYLRKYGVPKVSNIVHR